MELLRERYASSSSEDDDTTRSEYRKKNTRITAAPEVNVHNLSLAKVIEKKPNENEKDDDADDGHERKEDVVITRATAKDLYGQNNLIVVVPREQNRATKDSVHENQNGSSAMIRTNLTYDEMSRAIEGPRHPNLKKRDERNERNHHLGFVQTVNVDSFSFDAQYNTQQQQQQNRMKEQQRGGGGGGRDASGNNAGPSTNNNWDKKSVFDMTKKERRQGRDQALMEAAASFNNNNNNNNNNNDSSFDPNDAWAKNPGAKLDVMKKTELSKEQKEYLEWHAKRNDAKRKARGKVGDTGRDDDDVLAKKSGGEEDEVELKRRQQMAQTKFHGEEEFKYDGSSWLAKPKTLKSRSDRCYVPEKTTKQWKAHGKGVSHLEFFPNSGHVLLTCGMEGTAKIWNSSDENNKFKLLRSYNGHEKAIKSACFTPNDGSMFATCGWDHKVHLWDTETGSVVRTVSSGKTPLCLAFHPQKQNVLLVGQSDKKILQYDMQSGDVVQEYDQHLGGVNSISFCDDGKRFVSTSDDKTLRAWEFGIPVTMKYVADPLMHSMPSTKMHPDGDFLACQSLDNSIKIYSTKDRFREKRNKAFMGHQNAGYACEIAFSPDGGKYMASGDGDGRLFFWDFKTGKKVKTFMAHDRVCITLDWHPLLASRVASGSWDGFCTIWD